MSKLNQLANLGQSIWLDYIRRAFIDSGELQQLIDRGIRGVTSNPTIFEKAIAGSADYDSALKELAADGKSDQEIYETLALEDIGRAADLFRPAYDATDGMDGYVSLEVSPTLAHDSEGTVQEGRRLFTVLNRPNVMIKVPATAAGIPAITQLISEGINVNVTLMFSLDHYNQVAEAYLKGLEQLAAKGGDLKKVASVASFFISRLDTAVDRALGKAGNQELQGKIAIANAKMVYHRFQQIFSGDRWEKLARTGLPAPSQARQAGAQVQRVLWASTGTKNPLYPDTLYVDALIGAHTVNTVPPATLNAFLDHGKISATVETAVAEAEAQISQLNHLAIDLNAITEQLQQDGVASFAESFEKLMTAIAEKRGKIAAEKKDFVTQFNGYQNLVDSALEKLKNERIVQRIWEHDHTVWKADPDEISNRLGWLHSPEIMMDAVDSIAQFIDEIRAEGFTHALLLGMGGSSLAPEVFRLTFGVKNGYLDLQVLDSTTPGAVQNISRNIDPAKTLFIVSTKSGGTAETISFMKYFYNLTMNKVGRENIGSHFIAITDPGSGLEFLAKELKFRKIFLNDPNIGGRYSALSYFGLVPAGLIGVDLKKLLDRAQTMACNSEGCNCPVHGDNTTAQLGAVMGELAHHGRDKLTLVMSFRIAPFGAWAEQLIAESTGKEGRGILPVDGESLLQPAAYADDRLFVVMQLGDDTAHDEKVAALKNAGHPVVTMHLKDEYDLGGEFFRWEMATAIAGYFLKINPFDQPNVEAAKILAREMVAAYQEKGKLPEQEPSFIFDNIAVFTDGKAKNLKDALHENLEKASETQKEKPRTYVAIQAFVQPTLETTAALQELRTQIQMRYQLATTVGYGPRFLHSTGQLHKGDGGNGLFIQITSDFDQDAPIPDSAGDEKSTMSFGVLALAQALGDRQALIEAGRRVIRFHLKGDILSGIQTIAEVIR
jgi:transaldolase/glucose-6-phosphate isomerase